MTRQRKLVHSRHIPIQTDYVALQRDYGQDLLVQRDSPKMRRETENRCCCWRLETLTGFKKKKEGTVITYLQVFPQLFLISCVSRISFIVWMKKAVPPDFDQLRRTGCCLPNKAVNSSSPGVFKLGLDGFPEDMLSFSHELCGL